MPILYDQPFNGGFSEILLVKVGAPTAPAADILAVNTAFEEAFWLSQLTATSGSGTKKISIVGITWSINGGGLLALHDVNYETDQAGTQTPIIVLSGGGTWGTGNHNYGFANIKPTDEQGIRLLHTGTVVGYSVLLKIKKEDGYGIPARS